MGHPMDTTNTTFVNIWPSFPGCLLISDTQGNYNTCQNGSNFSCYIQIKNISFTAEF